MHPTGPYTLCTSLPCNTARPIPPINFSPRCPGRSAVSLLPRTQRSGDPGSTPPPAPPRATPPHDGPRISAPRAPSGEAGRGPPPSVSRLVGRGGAVMVVRPYDDGHDLPATTIIELLPSAASATGRSH